MARTFESKMTSDSGTDTDEDAVQRFCPHGRYPERNTNKENENAD
jgi:hypothetical protein